MNEFRNVSRKEVKIKTPRTLGLNLTARNSSHGYTLYPESRPPSPFGVVRLTFGFAVWSLYKYLRQWVPPFWIDTGGFRFDHSFSHSKTLPGGGMLYWQNAVLKLSINRWRNNIGIISGKCTWYGKRRVQMNIQNAIIPRLIMPERGITSHMLVTVANLIYTVCK